jgi:hypothetical protein
MLVAVDQANAVALPEHAPADSATDILVAELREVIACMRWDHERAIGDLQRDRDEWRDQAKRLALSAPVQAPGPTSAQVDTGGPLYRAWRWLRSAG